MFPFSKFIIFFSFFQLHHSFMPLFVRTCNGKIRMCKDTDKDKDVDYYIDEKLYVYCNNNSNNNEYLCIPLTHIKMHSYIDKKEQGYNDHIKKMLISKKPTVLYSTESINNYRNLVELYNIKWTDVKEIVKIEERYTKE